VVKSVFGSLWLLLTNSLISISHDVDFGLVDLSSIPHLSEGVAAALESWQSLLPPRAVCSCIMLECVVLMHVTALETAACSDHAWHVCRCMASSCVACSYTLCYNRQFQSISRAHSLCVMHVLALVAAFCCKHVFSHLHDTGVTTVWDTYRLCLRPKLRSCSWAKVVHHFKPWQ
jgi:hypothetical protein